MGTWLAVLGEGCRRRPELNAQGVLYCPQPVPKQGNFTDGQRPPTPSASTPCAPLRERCHSEERCDRPSGRQPPARSPPKPRSFLLLGRCLPPPPPVWRPPPECRPPPCR